LNDSSPPTVTSTCLPAVGGVFAINNGTNVKFNGDVNITGDTYLYQGAMLSVSGNPTISGTTYADATSVTTNPVGSTVLMNAAQLALRGSILDLATAAAGLTATQPLDPASPASTNLNRAITYNADPTKTLNVVVATDIMLASGQSITFNGGANATFALVISGDAAFGDGIVLTGGMTANHLLVYLGNGSSSLVAVGGTAGVAGTFLAPTRSLKFSGNGSFTGALISGAPASPAIEVSGNGGGQAGMFQADGFCPMK
jgi:hypothetical protein